MKTLLLVLLVFGLLRASLSISFYLDPDSKKCIREEVHKDVLVVGDYEVEDSTSQKTNIEVCHVIPSLRFHLPLQVIDSKGHVLFRKEEISNGKFAFTTEDYEMFDVCFHTMTTG